MELTQTLPPTPMVADEWPEGMRALTLAEKLHDLVFGCRHDFRFPISMMEYPLPYDSHQVCNKCGRMRLFNNKKWLSGPSFVKSVDVKKAA